jgi:hypothetical protein
MNLLKLCHLPIHMWAPVDTRLRFLSKQYFGDPPLKSQSYN